MKISMKYKIAFLTGLSNYANNTLSPNQIKFLDNVNTYQYNKLYLNFPFIDKRQKYQQPHIVGASCSNALQYLLSKTNWINKQTKEFRKLLIKQDKMILLVGSCGLEILRNMKLTESEKDKIYIIAYGAVAKKIPKYKNIKLIQGNKDWIARLFIKHYDYKINSHHMNYLESIELLNIVNHYIQQWSNE